MAERRRTPPRSRKSRAKGRTADQQFATAQRRIEEAKGHGIAKLDLSGLTKLSQFPPELAALTTLQSLDLNSTQISDLAPLAGLTALQRLDLDGTQVSDLAPIADLTALQSLYLRRTQVSDLAPLAGLTALQYLSLMHTQVSDLTPIAGFTALESLNINGTKVSDLAPIVGLTALQSLNLNVTQVSDLEPIADLTALQYLNLMDTQVSDVTPIAGFTALESLNLSGTHVSDLEPIAGLTALENLGLMDTQVSDLAPLVGFTALQSLDLTNTQVSDLTPIAALTGLADGVASKNAMRRSLGLDYANSPAARRSPFDRLVLLEQPARTVETLNEVRRQRGLPEHIPEGYRPLSELPPPSSLEPVPGIPSAFGFAVSSGKILLTSSSADLPVFPLPSSKRDHHNRLETSRTLADDLVSDLKSGKFNARPDYAESLTRYAQRLPKRRGDGHILLADAEARTLRSMFEADADILPVGLGSKLKTMLEQHIGLRVYYPEIEHFYRDVQSGRIESPLPLDAVQGVIRTVGTFTPEVFEPPVEDAIAGSATSAPEIATPSETDRAPRDLAQPKPPPDPLGEVNPRKARDFTVAGIINGLWKAFKEGEKVHKALDGWKNAGNALQPHVQRVLEWLRHFAGPGDVPPSLPPGLSA